MADDSTGDGTPAIVSGPACGSFIFEGQRDRLTGEAQAEGEKLKETARSSLAKLNMEVFHGDGESYLRYGLSQELSPDLRLRLFQSWPGTFWTNMGGSQGMNLLLQPNQPVPPRAAPQPAGGASRGDRPAGDVFEER
jgi:hypothetical protein